ncbi:three-helix bundle dimerization domain-containing protein [Corynebacterium sp. p3-SID1194]|uniref:three-helix bundle dimerization domain-containing protein n=1 Tax=Corynebacterium sp. p3-SID1194 TaxID=2916105 RepID=UPI0021A6B211|nr:hypothetical protein [Corynebacterium sp. p3-SID1194]MCT1450467.1 hypothetical protein [Corynebacterium sp. p3-SID1194]
MIAINNISKDLHARFDEELGGHIVETIFRDTLSEHLQRANVTDWVPVLAGRDAAEKLSRFADGTLDTGDFSGSLVAA